MKYNIMIGSCGGLTGFYLIKKLRKEYSDYNIFGFDLNNKCPSKKYITNIIKAPAVSNEEEFLSFLIEILIKNEIDIYIPTLSKEIKFVSKYAALLKSKVKSLFLVSPIESIEILETKDIAYKKLIKLGINVPEIYTNENLKFPMFIKPKYGSGSKNSFKIEKIEEYNFFKEKYPESFFMEYLKGKEYTVDAFFDDRGNLISYNQRIREKTSGGAVVISTNNFDYDFKDIILKISSQYKIYGTVNFQFIVVNGKRYLIDINLRFASGGLPLSIESNVDILELTLRVLLKLPIEIQKYQSDKKNRTMYRYYEEFYEEN